MFCTDAHRRKARREWRRLTHESTQAHLALDQLEPGTPQHRECRSRVAFLRWHLARFAPIDFITRWEDHEQPDDVATPHAAPAWP